MKKIKNEIHNVSVFIFRFRRKNYVFHRGFSRTYPSGEKAWIRPHWKKTFWNPKNPRYRKAMKDDGR